MTAAAVPAEPHEAAEPVQRSAERHPVVERHLAAVPEPEPEPDERGSIVLGYN